MRAIQRLLLVDFALSLAALYYFAVPAATTDQSDRCTTDAASAACQFALVNVQLFYGKSLAHSACILAGALAKEARTVALIAGGVCGWCFAMPALLWRYGFADRTAAAVALLLLFGCAYLALLARWWWGGVRY
ncbi:MAG: hypothetical protein HY902_06285 [Deltaproteobacteria bacterium]|nr:hypothetical protein [Deltaproteobacteria bacterium]